MSLWKRNQVKNSAAVRASKPRANWSYGVCLLIQATSAFAILYAIYRSFRTLVDEIGIAHQLPPTELALLSFMIAVFQSAYWYRLHRLEIPQWTNVPIGHALGFASRLSFIFGGALFSLFFLRHAPELRSSSGAFVLLPRIGILLASLFCMYCFSLELDRLASSLQMHRPKTNRRDER